MLWWDENQVNLTALDEEIESEETNEARRQIAERERDEIRATEPERDVAMQICIDAWFTLQTARQIGMEAGPIPWPAVKLWCDDQGLDYDMARQLRYVIHKQDADRAKTEMAKRKLAELINKGPR